MSSFGSGTSVVNVQPTSEVKRKVSIQSDRAAESRLSYDNLGYDFQRKISQVIISQQFGNLTEHKHKVLYITDLKSGSFRNWSRKKEEYSY